MVVAAPAREDTPGGGDVVWDAGKSELLLRAGGGQVYRLAWKAEDKDRRRRLPAGRYAILGYRVARTAKDGEEWFVSTTSNGKNEMSVRAGHATLPPLDTRVHLRFSVPIVKGKLSVRAGILGQLKTKNVLESRPLGLSIYRGGKRIPLDYHIVDERIVDKRNDHVAQSGTLRYG